MIFGAKYLGSTQLVSERNPPTSVRMAQAQEAVDRIKVQGGARPDLLWVLGSTLLQGRDPAVTSLGCFALQGTRGRVPAHDRGGSVRLHAEDQGADS